VTADETAAPTAPVASRSPETPAGRRREALALAAILLLFAVLAAALFVQPEEDAFIYYRYAWNWAHGQGLVFNAGDPVEGFSSPLWMGLLALAARLGLALPAAAPALGIACGAATVAATHALARRVGLDRGDRLAVALALALAFPFLLWARSGLETPFYSLLLVLAAGSYLSAEHPPAADPALRRRRQWASGLALAPVALARPEAILLLPVVAVDRLTGRGDRRGWLRHLLPAVAVYTLYLLARFATYGSLVPNTSVKLYPVLVGRSAGQLAAYVLSLGVLPFVLPVLALARGGGERWEARRLAFLAAVVLVVSIGFNFLAGGDYRPGFRFLVPTLPLLLVAAWLSYERLGRTLPPGVARALRSPLARALFLLLLLSGSLVSLGATAPSAAGLRRSLREWRDPYSDTGHWGTRIAFWVDAHVPPGSVVAFGQMGRVPYYLAARGHAVVFLDTLGLVDRRVARIYRLDQKLADLLREMRAGRSFREAFADGRRRRAAALATTVLERRPDFILVEVSLADFPMMRALTASPAFAARYREIADLPYVRAYVRKGARVLP
jgi:arabinofuranosyltransferase